MKKLITSIVMFSLILNFAVAIMIDTVPAFVGMDKKLGLSEDDTFEYVDNDILDEFGNPVNGYPAMQDSTNVDTNTLMDRIGLGSMTNLLNFFNKYMFGFVEVLRAVFGNYVSGYVFGVLKTLISLAYAFAAIELFTGKRLDA